MAKVKLRRPPYPTCRHVEVWDAMERQILAVLSLDDLQDTVKDTDAPIVKMIKVAAASARQAGRVSYEDIKNYIETYVDFGEEAETIGETSKGGL